MRSSTIALIALGAIALGAMFAHAHTGDDSNNCHFLNGSHVCDYSCRGFSRIDFEQFAAPKFQRLCRQARHNKLGEQESDEQAEKLNVNDPTCKRDICKVQTLTEGGLDQLPSSIDMTCSFKGTPIVKRRSYCKNFCKKALEATSQPGGIMGGYKLERKGASYDRKTKDCTCDYVQKKN
eukprot:Nk52_evm46s1020 gene=Nk52_evmTU46s1020